MKTGKIKAGDPGDSEFFETLTDDDDDLMPPPSNNPLDNEQEYAKMPANQQLSKCNINLLQKWIDEGFQE